MKHRQAEGRPARPWWQIAVVALAVLAVSLPLAARAVVGPAAARVHVRWQPALDAAAREQLEARFRLERRERLDEATWRYELADPSTANIRALVQHPAVADTHDLDRVRFSVERTAVRTGRRQLFAAGGDLAVGLADATGVILALAAVALGALGLAGRAQTAQSARAIVSQTGRRLWMSPAAVMTPVSRFLQRGIPDVSAETAGIFRMFFGVLVLAFLVWHRVDASVLDRAFDVNVNGDLHAAVLTWLRDRPFVVNLLTPWLVATGIAFTVGALTRLSYALFVAGVVVWAYVAVYVDSTHPHSTLILTLVALLPSRWGAAYSIDAWLRAPPRMPTTIGKHYGYSVWVPGLVFGIAFAAAAWAKLKGGPDWILNGSVKYHFATDVIAAPVRWGLQLMNYPTLAVIASLSAVATEALIVSAAFVRSELYRGVLGLAALMLLGGFWLFMGVVWAGWWILLLGFLPWGRLSTVGSRVTRLEGRERPPHLRRVTAVQLAMIVALVAQQVVISTLVIERAPMFTYYPMYSATWPTLDAFNASRPPLYRIVVLTDQGSVALRCSPSERLVSEFREAVRGSAAAVISVRRQLEDDDCGENVAAARQIVFEPYHRRFDRDRLEFITTPIAGILGPLTLQTNQPRARPMSRE